VTLTVKPSFVASTIAITMPNYKKGGGGGRKFEKQTKSYPSETPWRGSTYESRTIDEVGFEAFFFLHLPPMPLNYAIPP